MDYDSLFRQHYPSLFRYLQRLTGDPDLADDVAQEAFARLLEQTLQESEVRPWLFTVAMNLVRDDARSSSRRRKLLQLHHVEPEVVPTADMILERKERVEGVRRALARLKLRDRQLLLMREEGFSYAEMAQAIGVAPSSVGTMVARALKRFSEVYRLCEVGDDAHN